MITKYLEFIKEHLAVGGNSGYVGYSMSRRAATAYEEGKLTYSKLPTWAKRMVDAEMVSTDEWHHTSSYGNETPFYNIGQFIDKLSDAEKEEFGVSDWEDDESKGFFDVPKKVIKFFDEVSKKQLKIKQNVKEVKNGIVSVAQKNLNDFNAKFKKYYRIKETPKFGKTTDSEMDGKYGWFPAGNYNLPIYYSGIDYETEENYNKAQELTDELSDVQKSPIHKIELKKLGFTNEDIEYLKNAGFIPNEIMSKNFYDTVGRNKELIKQDLEKLKKLPNPTAKFSPHLTYNLDNHLTDEEKEAKMRRHTTISDMGDDFGSSSERRIAHQDNDEHYNDIAKKRQDKAHQDYLKSNEVKKQEENFNKEKTQAIAIIDNMKSLFSSE